MVQDLAKQSLTCPKKILNKQMRIFQAQQQLSKPLREADSNRADAIKQAKTMWMSKMTPWN